MEDKQKSLVKPLLVSLAVILLISGTGLGVWWWQNGKMQRTDSDKHITGMQNQDNPPKKESEKATIKGSLSYPSGKIPALTVCAMAAKTKKETCIKTKENDAIYEIKVDPGMYHILARNEITPKTAFYTNCDSSQKPADCNNQKWFQNNFACLSDPMCTEAFTAPKIEAKTGQTVNNINISRGWYLPCPSTECVNGQDNPKKWDNYVNCD